MDRKGSNSDLKNADRMRGGKSFGFSIHAFPESFAEYPLRQCLIGSASSVRQSSEELAGTYIFVNASPRRYGWRQCGGVYQLAPGAGRGIFDEPQITVSINYVADLEATRHREANMSTQAIDPLPGDVASLADLTEYQEGAIVSRTIVKREHGSVTLSAFDEGQKLSEHTTRFDALVQVVDGTAEIAVGGDSHRVSTGESILLPANVPHALSAVAQFKMILTMIDSSDG